MCASPWQVQTPLHECFLHQLSPSFFVNSTLQFSNHHQARLKLAFDFDLFLYGSELTPNGLVTAEFGHLRQLPSTYRVHTRCFRCSVNLQHPESTTGSETWFSERERLDSSIGIRHLHDNEYLAWSRSYCWDALLTLAPLRFCTSNWTAA